MTLEKWFSRALFFNWAFFLLPWVEGSLLFGFKGRVFIEISTENSTNFPQDKWRGKRGEKNIISWLSISSICLRMCKFFTKGWTQIPHRLLTRTYVTYPIFSISSVQHSINLKILTNLDYKWCFFFYNRKVHFLNLWIRTRYPRRAKMGSTPPMSRERVGERAFAGIN